MDYENDLLADLESDTESGDHVEKTATLEGVNNEEEYQDNTQPQHLDDLLQANHLRSVGLKLRQLDVSNVQDSKLLSSIYAIIPTIRTQLQTYANDSETDYLDLLAAVNNEQQSEEYVFLMQLSELLTLINDEISLLHKYVRVQYQVVFPELEYLVRNPVDYCQVINIIGQDLIGIRKHEGELKSFLTNDKVLAITMSALEQYKKQFELKDEDLNYIKQACKICYSLNEFLEEVSGFISGKLSKFAPNVAELIGPVATSQLLISVGSLQLLAATPSCNLPSFGVRDLLSQMKKGSHFIRATGYLFYCDLVRGLPPEFVRQALRIVSGKVILAARIDVSGASSDGLIGRKYLAEVKHKIDNLLTPPERSKTKALPAPVDQKSKKRGGRRFRKTKERFQMSELRKAQNKMEFGKEEQVVTDAFGDDVGLGLSKQTDGVKVNRNTDARISKSMALRLNSAKEKRENLETLLMTAQPELQKQNNVGRFGGLKRRRDS